MYKTIKIPEEAYEEAKLLSEELEKSKTIAGVFNVNLSTAISYAITKMLENMRKRKRFISSAGSWKDIENLDKIKEEIYLDRKISKRKEVLI
ncbi:hypothetical protein HYV88_03650 [Candidatus Woesearchaeota archaeon]|nr:hypothetical protein [Candidatus Woesearchaeota archaeon]